MGHSYGGEPRLVMKAAGIGWINAFVGLMLAIEVILVVALVLGKLPYWGAAVTLVSLMIVGIFIRAIVPQSFEIYDDRLVLVFAQWRWNVAIDSIELVQPARGWQAYGYWGIRFATAPGKAVEVRRFQSNILTRPNMIISPDDREFFLAEMNSALSRFRRLREA